MDVFLTACGIQRNQVRIVDLKSEEISPAFKSGGIYAVSVWNLVLRQLQKALGARGKTFYDEKLYTEMFCLVTRQAFVAQHPGIINNVLQALMKTGGFLQQNPDEARYLIASFTKTDKAIPDEVWETFKFSVFLGQALLVNLEDQSRWAIENRLTACSDMPNFLDHIYTKGLQSAKPESLRIIH